MDINIGKYLNKFNATVSALKQRDVTARIWRKDHTVWKPDPGEISNRLGWLTVTEQMREQVPALEAFSREIREAGFRHVVLLGMGGSSLGAEVLHKTFGIAKGYPEFITLDSTLPAVVQAITDTIEPAHTLFLVSSKSGTTIEPLSLMQYFKNLEASATGNEKTGKNFVAITDTGTPLARLAEEEKFRHVFLNPSDIGGRFSILSYFGLVPAALMGIDITTLLKRAEMMQRGCGAEVTIDENPGARLGAILGVLALHGRDKLTLVTSPSLSSVGLWLEQLIAESTGKDGKGIVPVVGEPLVTLNCYGDDRFFVYLRLANNRNAAIDEAMEAIRSSGQPVVVIEMRDVYDLGAEFFRWEFATAISGSVLGINPFDQPDVQAAKQATDLVLQEYITTGRIPPVETNDSLGTLLSRVSSGTYLAVIAYIQQTAEMEKAMSELRHRIVERYHITTTVGYGPRYLHSTGQLHKGGPKTGLFLQLTVGYEKDITIPGKPYTLGVLADAQALGDLKALQSSGRPVIKMHLKEGDISVLSGMVS